MLIIFSFFGSQINSIRDEIFKPQQHVGMGGNGLQRMVFIVLTANRQQDAVCLQNSKSTLK